MTPLPSWRNLSIDALTPLACIHLHRHLVLIHLYLVPSFSPRVPFLPVFPSIPLSILFHSLWSIPFHSDSISLGCSFPPCPCVELSVSIYYHSTRSLSASVFSRYRSVYRSSPPCTAAFQFLPFTRFRVSSFAPLRFCFFHPFLLLPFLFNSNFIFARRLFRIPSGLPPYLSTFLCSAIYRPPSSSPLLPRA